MQSIRPSIKRIAVTTFAIAAVIALSLAWWMFGQAKDSETSFGRIFNGPYRMADYELEFERTPCFGECPVFKLRIGKNGTASLDVPGDQPFDGTVKVPRIKDIRYSKTLTDEVRMDLIRSLEKGGFWKMDSNYFYGVTDNPGQRISVQSSDRSWGVDVYAVPCVTEYRSLKGSYMKDRKFEKLVPDVFCEMEKKLDAVACDVYQKGSRSGDDGTLAIWPPQCDTKE